MTDDRLLDRCWDALHAYEDLTPLWDGDLDQLERWPTTAPARTAAARAEVLALAEQARAAAEAGGELAPSLRTASDGLRLLGARSEITADLFWVSPIHGLQSFLQWSVNDMALVTAEHGERYLTKLARFPDAVDELRGRLEAAAAVGRAPVASHSQRTAAQLDELLAASLADDPLLQQAPPTELDAADATAWRAALADAVATHVRPALARLRGTVADVCVPAGRSDERCGIVHLDGGAEEYATLLAAYTVEGSTPEQVHAIGLQQLAVLEGRYRELGREAFGTDDVVEVFRRLRDPAMQHHDGDEVVAEATGHHERAVAVAGSWFSRVPDAPCELRGTPHGAIAFYARPKLDGSRPGICYLNVAEPSVWGANLASTVFHEAIPGHHFQLALAQQDTHLHDVHRELFMPAFGEGWALYAEQLADEIGLYTDPVQRLGMLVADSMRACRLVVDTGMHAFGWSRQRAIGVMLANAPMGKHEVTAEIDRYIGDPGQATSYMMGRLEIERLRAESEQRLGAGFDVRAFHDVVLSHGMLSLPALRMVVESWDGAPVPTRGRPAQARVSPARAP